LEPAIGYEKVACDPLEIRCDVFLKALRSLVRVHDFEPELAIMCVCVCVEYVKLLCMIDSCLTNFEGNNFFASFSGPQSF